MALTVKQVGAGIAHLPPLAPVEVPRNRYATVPTGNVRVIPVDRDADAVEAIIDGVCLPTGSGYGGWTVTPRDGQKGLVEYTGVEPVRYTLPLLLDGWIDRIVQQDAFDALLDMAGGIDEERPGEVYVIGSVPRQVSAHPWRIETVAIGTKTEKAPDHNGVSRLYRQDLVLTLIEPNDPSFTFKPVKRAQAKAKKGSKAKAKAPVYVVAKQGDTLLTIAARYRKDWHDLAKLNGIRDPTRLNRGQRVRVS